MVAFSQVVYLSSISYIIVSDTMKNSFKASDKLTQMCRLLIRRYELNSNSPTLTARYQGQNESADLYLQIFIDCLSRNNKFSFSFYSILS